MLEQLLEKINSELLTDEVKLEMTTMFESAVNQAIESKEVELEEANKAEIAEFKEELVGKLDEYLAYFVEEFVKENEGPIEDSAKVQMASKVLGIFDGLVKEFNIQLDEQTIEDNEQLDEAKKTISSQTEELLALRKEVQAMKVDQIVEEKASDFETDSEKEKFRKLAGTVTIEEGDFETFGKKLVVLAESIGQTETPTEQKHTLEEEEVDSPEPPAAPQGNEPEAKTTDRYMQYL